MSITPNLYAKARSEIIALFGWDAGGLSPDQVLRIDCAVALRLALDDLQGRIVRGESADVARMLTASEALARLLPPAVLSTPPAEEHGDPRQVMWELYRTMRERGELAGPKYSLDAALKRIDELEAQLGLAPVTKAGDVEFKETERPVNRVPPLDVPPSDIVPPGEYLGVPPMRGPDDPPKRSSVTIDAKAAPAAPAGYDYNREDGWRDYVEPDGSIRSTPRSSGRWWGPV